MGNLLNLLKKSFKNAIILGLPQPNYICILNVTFILEHLIELSIEVDFINPSSEGGFIIEFVKDNKYHMFEVDNDGEVILLKKDGDKREVFDDFDNVYEYLNML